MGRGSDRAGDRNGLARGGLALLVDVLSEACDTEVTVQGRGKKAWALTKDGRAYADVAEGLDSTAPS